jgi:hypothetical protein
MGKPIVCWRCGAAVKPEQRPITRLELCRRCSADLHVCRMCRSYNPRMTGHCDHDHAEPPLDRERANFCQYFKPRPGAYSTGEQDAEQGARKELDSLFGVTPGDVAAPETGTSSRETESDRARAEIERLFNKPPPDED